jgi:hypothetical protein
VGLRWVYYLGFSALVLVAVFRPQEAERSETMQTDVSFSLDLDGRSLFATPGP